MNMNNFMQMLQQSQANPRMMVMDMLQSQVSANNPVMNNLFLLAQNNDAKGIEQVARNLVKERGLDFDKEFENFKKTFNL